MYLRGHEIHKVTDEQSKISPAPCTVAALPRFSAMIARCTTNPQQQGQYIRPTLQQIAADNRACVSTAYAKYPTIYASDLNTGASSIAQLADESRPTLEQALLYAARHDDILACRHQFREAIASAWPDIVPILDNEWAAADQVNALVIERKISWAESARRMGKIAAQGRSQLAAAKRELRAQR